MGNFIERLQVYMEFKGINDNQMTIDADLSNGLLGKLKKSGKGMNSINIEKILISYPDLSADWLLTGRGNMLKEEKNSIAVENYQYRPDDEIIEVENPPIIPRELTKRPNTDLLQLVRNADEDLTTSRVKVEGLAFTMWVRVGDAALEPHYHPEDKLALIAYPVGHEHFVYGKVHGIDTISNGMILRRLYPHQHGYIAKSYAPEEFPDLFIPFDDVIRIYRALMQVRTL